MQVTIRKAHTFNGATMDTSTTTTRIKRRRELLRRCARTDKPRQYTLPDGVVVNLCTKHAKAAGRFLCYEECMSQPELKPKEVLAIRCSLHDEEAMTYTNMFQLGPYPGWHLGLASMSNDLGVLKDMIDSKKDHCIQTLENTIGDPRCVWQVLCNFQDRDSKMWLTCEFDSVHQLAVFQKEKFTPVDPATSTSDVPLPDPAANPHQLPDEDPLHK